MNQNRRCFLQTLAAVGVTLPWLASYKDVMQAQGTSVLTASDFTYLGCMRVPEDVSQFSRCTFAARMVNGHLQCFLTGANAPDLWPDVLDAVYEFLDTESYHHDPAFAPRAELLTKWGDIYQGKRIRYADGVPEDLNDLATSGLAWHDGKLYWTFMSWYNVDGLPDPSIGMTVLGADPSEMVAYGPWNADVTSHHSAGWLIDLPDGTLGVGSLPQGGNAQSSWGPELMGGSVWPSETTPAGPDAPLLAFPDTYVRHGYRPTIDDINEDGSVMAGVEILRAKRPNNFIWNGPGNSDINPLVMGNQGYWTEADGTYAAVYIRTDTKVGFLFASTLGIENVWYGDPDLFGGNVCQGGQGENANSYQLQWAIYDPADCAKVIAGELEPHRIAPSAEFDPNDLAPTIYPGCPQTIGGMHFEPTTGKLYVAAPLVDRTIEDKALPVIHVFQIS